MVIFCFQRVDWLYLGHEFGSHGICLQANRAAGRLAGQGFERAKFTISPDAFGAGFPGTFPLAEKNLTLASLATGELAPGRRSIQDLLTRNRGQEYPCVF